MAAMFARRASPTDTCRRRPGPCCHTELAQNFGNQTSCTQNCRNLQAPPSEGRGRPLLHGTRNCSMRRIPPGGRWRVHR